MSFQFYDSMTDIRVSLQQIFHHITPALPLRLMPVISCKSTKKVRNDKAIVHEKAENRCELQNKMCNFVVNETNSLLFLTQIGH